MTGNVEGTLMGIELGVADGFMAIGEFEGTEVGAIDGAYVGVAVASTDGQYVDVLGNTKLGILNRNGVIDGELLGVREGVTVGADVGSRDGT